MGKKSGRRWARAVLFVGVWSCHRGAIIFHLFAFTSVLNIQCPSNSQRYRISLVFKGGQDESRVCETPVLSVVGRQNFPRANSLQWVSKALPFLGTWHIPFYQVSLYQKYRMPCGVHHDGILPWSQVNFQLCLTLGNKYLGVSNALTGTLGLITHLFTTASNTIAHSLEMP